MINIYIWWYMYGIWCNLIIKINPKVYTVFQWVPWMIGSYTSSFPRREIFFVCCRLKPKQDSYFICIDTFQMILRTKENLKKINFSKKIWRILFFLESSETYPKKCSAMISLRHHEIILLAMNNKKLRGTNVVAERMLSI